MNILATYIFETIISWACSVPQRSFSTLSAVMDLPFQIAASFYIVAIVLFYKVFKGVERRMEE